MSTMSAGELAYQEAHISENRAPMTIGVLGMLLFLSFVAVGLRLYTRRMTRVVMGWDDYCIIAALFFSCLVLAEIITMCAFGFGRHAIALTVADGGYISKTLFVFEVTWPFQNWTVKASLLFLYLRVFEWRFGYFRLAWWIVFLWVCGLFLGFQIAALTQCTPISLFWDTSIQDPCRANFTPSMVMSTLNSIGDLAILLLPMPALWSLHMPLKQKIATSGVFVLGSLVLVVSIVRIPIMESGTTSIDSTYAIIPALILIYLEPTVGLLCACLIVMRPLWSKIRGHPSAVTYGRSTAHSLPSRSNVLNSSVGRSDKYRSMGTAGPDEELGNEMSSILVTREYECK